MNLQPYIAVFFAIIFFGKFLLIDAKFLQKIHDSNEVVYVNPYCKKNKTLVSESEIPQDLLPASTSQGISIDSFCNTPFHFEIEASQDILLQTTFQHYSYTSPGNPQIFRDRFYPPPKVV